MTTPWFLDLLGLVPPVTERDVKRAYAQRIKTVDPERDPAGFEKLRAAYEAARAHLAVSPVPSVQQATPTPVPPPPELAPAEVRPAPPMSPPPAGRPAQAETPVQMTNRLLDRFCHRIHEGDARFIESELESSLAPIRLQHLDAAALFEALLIDRLRAGGMRQRALVFRVASTYFGWHEVGHFRRLGPQRGGWIEAVERQRAELTVVAGGSRLMNALEQVTFGGLMNRFAPLWPAAQEAARRYPELMALYLDADLASDWERRYASTPGSPAHTARSRAVALKLWIVLGVVMGGCFLMSMSEKSPAPEPSLELHGADGFRGKAGECRALAQLMKAPGAKINGQMRHDYGVCRFHGFIVDPAAAPPSGHG